MPSAYSDRRAKVAPAALLAVAASLCTATVMAAQDAAAPESTPTPRYEVRRATGPITIDGVLDDSAWGAASAPAALRAGNSPTKRSLSDRWRQIHQLFRIVRHLAYCYLAS